MALFVLLLLLCIVGGMIYWLVKGRNQRFPSRCCCHPAAGDDRQPQRQSCGLGTPGPGDGSAAVVTAAATFLALPNRKEAQEAVAWGQDMGRSWSAMGGGGSFSESFSEALGRSEEYSEADQRVSEPIVEPNVLRGLSATAMIYVEVWPEGVRRVADVDFNPQVALVPRVAILPFELAAP